MCPVMLTDLNGRCVYASTKLAMLLQCGIGELMDDRWRCRISPFADRPFDSERMFNLARSRTPLRLRHPHGLSQIVSRVRTVTNPDDSAIATGFLWSVQVVRIHTAPHAQTA